MQNNQVSSSTKKKKKKSTATKKNTKETGKGNPHFTRQEMLDLAKIVDEQLPIGQDSWQQVAEAYNDIYSPAGRERDLANLRRKYNNLVKVQKPTGDPTMPEHTKIAKRAHYKIIDVQC